MELRHLQYFIAVAETLNFHRAAERLHISQPAVSAQIHDLEEKLGVELFVRGGRQVRLTDIGRLLLHKAKAILAELNEFQELANRASAGKTGTIRVGVDMGLAKIVQSVVAVYAQQFPRVNIEYSDVFSDTINRDLREGEMDAGILYPPIDTDHLISEQLLEQRFLVVVPETSPLAKRKTLSVKDLANLVLLFSRRNNCINDKVMEMCREAGVNPKIAYTWTLPQEAGMVLVETGKGVYVLPGSEDTVRRYSKDIVAVPLEGACSLAVHVAWRKSETAIAVLNFVDTARRLFHCVSTANAPSALTILNTIRSWPPASA
jgi:DNA-binding transcriptional LysR family regulator